MDSAHQDDLVAFSFGDLKGLPRIDVGPGCTRIDLPAHGSAKVWIVDIKAGHEWPRVDRHDERGEIAYVVFGELIESNKRYGAGSYLYYQPHSTHRPRTEIGVRLFGFNIVAGKTRRLNKGKL